MTSSELLIRSYINIAGLSLLVYDTFLNWSRESEYIWRNNAPWNIKLNLCISRYFAIAVQITNVIESSVTLLGGRRIDCLIWNWFQLAGMQVLYWNMEAVMMVIVYALYNRSVYVGRFLFVWSIICRGYDAWWISATMQQVELDANCLAKRQPPAAKWTIPLTFLNQSVFWSLIYHKYRSSIGEGWRNSPLIRLLMRDSSVLFLGLLFSIIPCEIYIQHIIHSVVPIMICVLSIMSNRLILNMRSLKGTSGDVEQFEILTEISVQEEQLHT